MKNTLLLAVLSLAAAVLHGAADKPYQMFTGTDIDLSLQGRLCRVDGVKGQAFLVSEGGRNVAVPMSKAGALRIAPSVKVVTTLAQVDNLKMERTYTADSNPQRQMMAQLQAVSAQQDNMDLAQARTDAFAGSSGLGAKGAVLDQSMYPGMTSAEASRYSSQKMGALIQYQSQQNLAENNAFSDLSQNGEQEAKIQQKLTEELYNAMHISFAVSCSRLLTEPYAIVTVHYREPGKGPRPAHWWIFAERLDPIQPETHRVDIVAGGLPPGFTYDRAQIHLYDHGSEVATTVSTNWISLSEDEAFLLLVADYMGAHQGATLAPAPVLRAPTRPQAAVLMRAGAPRYVYVAVDKDGNATGAFVDAQCTQPVPEGLVSITLMKVRFTPALKDGRPAPGVARLDLD